MYDTKGLSPHFICPEYIVNHAPTKVLKDITPKLEAWSNTKPNVSHFYVFGSKTWVHIPKEERKALQPKSERYIFIRYPKDVKDYKFLQVNSTKSISKRC